MSENKTEENTFLIQVSSPIETQVDQEEINKLQSTSQDSFYPGQIVIVQLGYVKKNLFLQRVKSVSKTGQLLLENGMRFLPNRLLIGRRPGDDLTQVLYPTPDLVEEALHQRNIKILQNTNWALLNNETQERIIDILDEAFKG